MERAGEALAYVVPPHEPFGARATRCSFAGPGNNGGDAYVAARHLEEQRFRAFASRQSTEPKQRRRQVPAAAEMGPGRSKRSAPTPTQPRTS